MWNKARKRPRGANNPTSHGQMMHDSCRDNFGFHHVYTLGTHTDTDNSEGLARLKTTTRDWKRKEEGVLVVCADVTFGFVGGCNADNYPSQTTTRNLERRERRTKSTRAHAHERRQRYMLTLKTTTSSRPSTNCRNHSYNLPTNTST